MKVSYLGTGAAEGIPALFCNCEYCKGVRRRKGKEIRSRSQVIVDGELSIDFPPDAFYHAAVLGADLSAVRYLLVTHAHMDHFSAQNFILRGYKYAHGISAPELEIYGNAETGAVFAEETRRELKTEIANLIRFHTVGALEEVRFGDWRVHTLKAQHSSKEPLLFLIEKGNKRILHLTDTGTLPQESFDYLAKLGGKACDLITLDCTFLFGKTEQNARHMGLDENMRVLSRLQEIGIADMGTKKVITHFSHNAAATEEALDKAEREYGVIAAYDGMEIEI